MLVLFDAVCLLIRLCGAPISMFTMLDLVVMSLFCSNIMMFILNLPMTLHSNYQMLKHCYLSVVSLLWLNYHDDCITLTTVMLL